MRLQCYSVVEFYRELHERGKETEFYSAHSIGLE